MNSEYAMNICQKCGAFIHPESEEKTWHLWDLTPGTIEAIMKEKGLSLAEKDLDEIAINTENRRVEKILKHKFNIV